MSATRWPWFPRFSRLGDRYWSLGGWYWRLGDLGGRCCRLEDLGVIGLLGLIAGDGGLETLVASVGDLGVRNSEALMSWT